MSQTKAGAAKAKQTIINRYGEDHWKKCGAIGGRNGNTGGFRANREVAMAAGSKGGKLSKRGHTYIKSTKNYNYYLYDGEIVRYKK